VSSQIQAKTVALITMGCARNEVDSEELAGRLAADGWTLVDDPAFAEAVVVNTCGFVDVAKKDSIDAILAASELKDTNPTDVSLAPKAVVAVGCLAQRYGSELAETLPEADAVLSFDDYPEISSRLQSILSGEKHIAHSPSDRRKLLPISPIDRVAGAESVDISIPGHGGTSSLSWQPPVLRQRLDSSPVAPVKLASGCDRRCTFCAIPSFRGSFISRPPADVIAEIAWLANDSVTEVVLVSENSTSYGKDLGDLRLLEALLPAIGQGTEISRVRVAYLQPAEVRPDLLRVMAGTSVVAPYFDLSFQHASPTLLRRMKRFGGEEQFLDLIETIRELSPEAGIRSNVIVGFPGETDEDFATLLRFLERGRLDAVGVFGYSDEEGTEAFSYEPKVPDSVINVRVKRTQDLVDELMSQRAEDRIGQTVEVVVESVDSDSRIATGHAGHQGPDDSETHILGFEDSIMIGQLVKCIVTDTEGVDLIARPI
jgi:ribosomal protein S12 methylthiotransferase